MSRVMGLPLHPGAHTHRLAARPAMRGASSPTFGLHMRPPSAPHAGSVMGTTRGRREMMPPLAAGKPEGNGRQEGEGGGFEGGDSGEDPELWSFFGEYYPTPATPVRPKKERTFLLYELFGDLTSNPVLSYAFTHNSPLRNELAKADPSLNQSLVSNGTTISQPFTQDQWERHRRIDRYIGNVRRLAHSTVFRRVLRPCIMIAAVALVVCFANTFAVPVLRFSPVAHSLVGSAIGLLLVFRFNSSYARFDEGRRLWGMVIRSSREMGRLATCYLKKGSDRDQGINYVVCFAWLLKAHVRQGRTRADANDVTAYRDDPKPALERMLPPSEVEEIMAEGNKPYYMLLKLTDILRREEDTINPQAHQAMQLALQELGVAAGGCERILGTPLPLSYTRHTARSIMMWLLTLPMALWDAMGWWTPVICFFSTFILLGIDENGLQIEEPFCILPLQQMCEVVERDMGTAKASHARLRAHGKGGQGAPGGWGHDGFGAYPLR